MTWHNESARHALARKGIKTGLAYAPIAKGANLAIGASFAVAENTITVLEPNSILGGVKGGIMAQYLKADMDEYSVGEKIGRIITKRKETKEQKQARKIKEKLTEKIQKIRIKLYKTHTDIKTKKRTPANIKRRDKTEKEFYNWSYLQDSLELLTTKQLLKLKNKSPNKTKELLLKRSS